VSSFACRWPQYTQFLHSRVDNEGVLGTDRGAFISQAALYTADLYSNMDKFLLGDLMIIRMDENQ
jgi:hypothetical protein